MKKYIVIDALGSKVFVHADKFTPAGDSVSFFTQSSLTGYFTNPISVLEEEKAKE